MDEVRQPLVVRQSSLLHLADPLIDVQRRFLVVEQPRRIRSCLLLQGPELLQSGTKVSLIMMARRCLRSDDRSELREEGSICRVEELHEMPSLLLIRSFDRGHGVTHRRSSAQSILVGTSLEGTQFAQQMGTYLHERGVFIWRYSGPIFVEVEEVRDEGTVLCLASPFF